MKHSEFNFYCLFLKIDKFIQIFLKGALNKVFPVLKFYLKFQIKNNKKNLNTMHLSWKCLAAWMTGSICFLKEEMRNLSSAFWMSVPTIGLSHPHDQGNRLFLCHASKYHIWTPKPKALHSKRVQNYLMILVVPFLIKTICKTWLKCPDIFGFTKTSFSFEYEKQQIDNLCFPKSIVFTEL